MDDGWRSLEEREILDGGIDGTGSDEELHAERLEKDWRRNKRLDGEITGT